MPTTEYGLKWGPVEVIRAASDPKLGYWLDIETPYQRMQIRVSPTGRVMKTGGPWKRET